MAGPEAAEAEMPATVAAAWGVRERPQKGPKPTLSLARIVDAGVRVADTEGLDAVSMGRVAASLDTAPMSLYRHVSAKEELIRLMVDAAQGDSPGPLVVGENWRAAGDELLLRGCGCGGGLVSRITRVTSVTLDPSVTGSNDVVAAHGRAYHGSRE